MIHQGEGYLLTSRHSFIIIRLIPEFRDMISYLDATLKFPLEKVSFVHEQNLRWPQYLTPSGLFEWKRTICTCASSLLEEIVFHSMRVSSRQLMVGSSAKVSSKEDSGAKKRRAVISLK